MKKTKPQTQQSSRSLTELKTKSLAVKYRPNSLRALVGQSNAVQQITAMINKKALPSCILITGITGTGKTTLSRIIAKILNCCDLDENLVPCGVCPNCKDSSAYYQENNTASDRGIDNIRNLGQLANMIPMGANIRVICLDEVHQLQAASSSALLKFVEDTPPQTLWILATSNPEKLLNTIPGRCARINLQPIETPLMTKRLMVISKREGIDMGETEAHVSAIAKICEISMGSMRNAVSYLESIILTLHTDPDADIKSILKSTIASSELGDDEHAANLLYSIKTGNAKGIVKIARTTNVRAVLSKLRWLVQYYLDKAVGIAKFTPYSAKCYVKITRDETLSVRELALLQLVLVELEDRLNEGRIDESVIFLSKLVDFCERYVK